MITRKRHTYSLTNAVRYFAIYDQVLDMLKEPLGAQRELTISADDVRLSPITLQSQVTDGLKWVVENWNLIPEDIRPRYPHKDYILLKHCAKVSINHLLRKVTIKLRVSTTVGIAIDFIKGHVPLDDLSPGQIISVESIITPRGPSNTRRQIEDFIEDKDQTVKQFRDVIFSDGDTVWLKGLLASPGIVGHIEGTTLTLVKEGR